MAAGVRGLKVNQARRLKRLEKETARLKKLVAEKELDLSILKEVAKGNFCAQLGGARRWRMYGGEGASQRGVRVGY